MTRDELIELLAKAACFAPMAHDAGDGTFVMERHCDCETPDDCFEYRGQLKQDMRTQAETQLAALDKAGLAVVLVEPTKLMLELGSEADRGMDEPDRIWAVMRDAGRVDKEPEDD